MKKHFQTTLLGLSIFLILSSLVVNADPPKTTTPEVRYQQYKAYKEQTYHRFLATPAPKGLYYNTEMAATANIDDTPEKETVVLMLVDVDRERYLHASKWVQAFLLIANAEAAELEKKDLFKLYDTGTHALEVPAAKAIELQSPPYVFAQPPKDALKSRDATFRLVDLTGDGTLDVWFKSSYGVAVISFQNGEFKEVFSSYTIPGLLSDAEYVDLDNDGTYEIKVPYSIHIDSLPGAPHLEWMSLYEWNGITYILNNERFYAGNNDFLIQLLGEYNYQLLQHGRVINQCETYRFYLGLIYYYRGSETPVDLKWILEHGKNDDYIQTAESLLKKFPPE